MQTTTEKKIRLDKWLWAARFFKTRNLAIDAINGGKVHLNGQRCKPSKEVHIGHSLNIRIGFTERTVIVQALSDQRRPASEAQLLYEETPDSIVQREKHAAERKLNAQSVPTHSGRPTKKDRRQIRRFTDFRQD